MIYIAILLLLTSSAYCQKPPNIVFILADDLGFNDVGYHGKDHFSGIKTPYIDKLVKEGVKLHNYYVQPVCTPTRGQLLTGMYQIRTGLNRGVIWPNQRKALPLHLKILPEQLRECGYETHMVGKWHLGFYKKEFMPHYRGFDSYYGMLASMQNYFTHKRCYKRYCGYDMYSSKAGGPVNDSYGEYATHLFTRKSVEAIRNRNKEKPFFLYLAHFAVHIPVQVPAEYQKLFSHIKSRKRQRYAGMVYALDESIRNLTEYLRKENLLDDTIIVFSTDNGGIVGGGGNNWPLRGEKRTLWEGGVRAVGFMYGKPLGVAGTTYKGLLDVSDWFPTLLKAAQCPILNGTQSLDGIDQWDSIRGLAPPPRHELLHNIGAGRRPTKWSVQDGFNIKITAAIRQGKWKLLTGNPGPDNWVKPPEYEGEGPKFIRGSKKLLQLFDVENDRSEKNDLASKHPEVVKTMLRALARHSASIGRSPGGIFDPKADPELHGGFWQPWVE